MIHWSPLNLANIVFEELEVTSNKIYMEFSSLIITISASRFVNQWNDGDQHSAKTAICTNYVTVAIKIEIFMGQWVNPTDP
jgi:hypothetical protein